MYSKLSEKELEFMECWYDPTAMTECLIPENLKASWAWDEEECPTVKVRNYQFAMQNYSYMYADDSDKKPRDNFSYKVTAGKIFNIAARNLGKSYWIWIDAFLTLLHSEGDESMLASCDDTHLKKVADPLLNMAREHPVFKIFKKTGTKSDGIKGQPIEIGTQLGHVLFGRNENINDPEPGQQFHSIHAKTLFYEEFSYATKMGTEKRVDSVSSLGCIERLSGIPDIRVGSPLGDLLKDKKNKKFICRLPQSVREDWDENSKEEQAAKYGGLNSSGFKLNVNAEILEGAYGKWDMERIRKNCLDTDEKIKFFEVQKEIFSDFENYNDLDKKRLASERLAKQLVITKVPSIKRIIASDIGTTGSPSEVAIYFGDDKNNWKYIYQISLFKLTVKEQAYVFNWLYNVLDSAFIALDCSNADGRAIRDELLVSFKIPIEHLSDFRMQQNIEVDFLRDEKGRVVKDKNHKPIMREEYTKAWGIQQLELIFYNSKLNVPYDEKFLNQFGNHFEKRGVTGRPSWGSSTEEHLVDTFILFALCAWEHEFKGNQKLGSQSRCVGYI